MSTILATQLLSSKDFSVGSHDSNEAQIPTSKPSMLDHSTSTSMVSAFCRAVLAYIIPPAFWGYGLAKNEHEKVFLQNVDRFIKLRRFETLSLHEISQGIKVISTETVVF